MISEHKRKKKRWPAKRKIPVMELLRDYTQKFLPWIERIPYCRVGKASPDRLKMVKTQAERNLLSSHRSWVHYVVITAEKVILVWGSLKPDEADIAKLKLRMQLAPYTPELQRYKHLPSEAHLVSPIKDPIVKRLAEKEGIKFVRFSTPEIEEHLATRPGRERERLRYYPRKALK
jgi:hypothetical protein